MLDFLAALGANQVEEVTLATERLRFSSVRV
jgi:hypothetical protein